MKVYSLYDKDKTFLGAFPSRDMCICYAKVLHPNADGWDYDVIEEYLSKTPITYTSLHSMPCDKELLDTGITLLSGTPQINTYGSVRAE
jgi:hypothetical protein